LNGDEEATQKLKENLLREPRVISYAFGEGSGFTTITLLAFSTLSEAVEFITDFRKKYMRNLGETLVFFVPIERVGKYNFVGLVGKLLEI
jgi:hypothetical protein